MRAAVALAAVLATAATPGWGQLPHLMPPDSPWLDVNYPKVFWTPRDGLTGGLYVALVRQLSFDDAMLPPPYAGAVSLDGQVSTSGSRHLTLDGRFPHLVPGWRAVLTLTALRRTRQNYFGLGNASVRDEALVTDAQEHYYRRRDNRLIARAEIQRQVVGGLRLLAGAHLERWRIDPPGGPSRLALDAAGGVDPTIGQATSDITLRGGVVFDTRDDEVAPNTGVHLELIHGGTVAGDLDYTRTTGSAAAYVSLGQQVGLSARGVGQRMGGTPWLGSYYLIEASDRPFTGLGGSSSHRGLSEHRFAGRHLLLFNVDLKYHLVNLPRSARFTVSGFVDAGRVFEGEEFRLTTDGLTVGGGLGLTAQLGRAGIIGATVGVGPDGVVMHATTRWAY